MDYQTLYAKTVKELRDLAKTEGIRIPSGISKMNIVQIMLEEMDKKAKAAQSSTPLPEKREEKPAGEDKGRSPAPEKQVSEPASEKQAVQEISAPAEKKEKPTGKEEPQKADSIPAKKERKTSPAGNVKAQAKKPETRRNNKQQNNRSSSHDRSADLGKQTETRQNAPTEGNAAGTKLSKAPGMEKAAAAEKRDVPVEKDIARKDLSREDAQIAQAARNAMRAYRQNVQANAKAARLQKNTDQVEKPAMQKRFVPKGQDVTSAHVVQAQQVSARPTPGVRQEQPRYQRREFVPQDPTEVTQAVSDLLANSEVLEGAGVLELMPDGYGFLRAHNCQPGPNDAYLSAAQIRRFNLRQGDYVTGRARPQREGDRYMAMLYIDTINGDPAEKAINRPRFEDLTPVFPTERIRMERKDDEKDLSLRIIDLLAPIGKGQRALVVSQPKAGKTVLLKKIANAITVNNPEIKLIVLLIDERPEEVTDMQRSIKGDVVYSTFDEIPENHAHVSELALETAKRHVEQGKDVVILLDSITRLARAYNLVIPPTGRTLSGGIDPGSLHKPKRFFGAARNIEKGGSLTIIATALVETGSRADDIIYEEFKGTGNSEIHLDRRLSERRIFPAIDMKGSGTRREEMLLSEEEMECALSIRRLLSNAQDDAEQLLSLMEKTPNNEEFCRRMRGWISNLESNGYSFG